LVSDFSVYDAFESGLVKVVRLPDPDDRGHIYLDMWHDVNGARTKGQYLSACKGAIASLYSGWNEVFQEWQNTFESMRVEPAPVLLVVADRAERAQWLFEHLSRDYPLLKNPDDEDCRTWSTIRIDSKVFDAETGNEAVLREMVNTVGVKGKAGENVRCIVSVNMLSEGWDVKSVTHILGLRAFGSPLLTEQIIGRGLRLTNYDLLSRPVVERPGGSEETVDAFGIPFVGFPVEKRRRARTGDWTHKPVWIEKEAAKSKYRVRIPNVRSWGVGVTRPLADVLDAQELPELAISPKVTPDQVKVKPVVGGKPEEIMTLDRFRSEFPLLRSKMIFARELFEATNPSGSDDLLKGPTFEELFEFASRYVDNRVRVIPDSEKRDIGIYYWSRQALNILETAIRVAPIGTSAIPILGKPEAIDTEALRRFQWTGILAEGKKCHLNKVPCHSDLEREFADFLDDAKDVVRYVKNERLGFSITYYENKRPRQYFPDFVVVVREADGREIHWLAETKGEVRENTKLKREAAELWCQKMSLTAYGTWRYLFVPQRKFERARSSGVSTFADLADTLVRERAGPLLRLVPLDDTRVATEWYKSLLPLYSLKAAAGYFGKGEHVEPEGWMEAEWLGTLDERMFVAKAVGRSMEPKIHDGDYCVFRADPVGTKQGKIVLAKYRGPADPDTGGSFTVKRYSSEKIPDPDGDWRHTKVTLSPINPAFQPIILTPESEGDVHIVAEFLDILGRA
jgi:SOS-response transcriptional repressor LexA